jgi:hypothetical protein
MGYRLTLNSMLLIAVFSLASSPTFAAVLNFEEFPHDYELQGIGDVITSQGYTLTYTPAPEEPYPVGFFSVGPSWQFNARSTAIIANSCSATTTLTSNDNKPMTILSIDLDELNGDNIGSVTFIGLTVDGTFVKKSVRLNGKPEWQIFHFSSAFKNLKSVSWTQGDCLTTPPHMFDNIRVIPTTNNINDD